MPVRGVRRVLSSLLPAHSGFRSVLASLILFIGCNGLQNAAANGDTRTISLHHVHTNEDLTITYKRNGRYDPEALKKINWLLRDWRRNEAIDMDPQLIDLLWEVQRDVGATRPIDVICGYRAPQTNAMLRRVSDGVAEFSQHTLGKAIDFYIPGVALKDLRDMALRLQRGGIGFYPTSGSPFVHLDIGHVRHWPAISREELVRVFPNGRTVHVPSDGRPLAGYALALADVEARGNEPSQPSLNAARQAGLLNASTRKPSLLASLFGTRKSEAADVTTTASINAPVAAAAAPVPLPRRQPTVVKVAAAAPVASPAEPEPATLRPIQLAKVETASLPWSDQALGGRSSEDALSQPAESRAEQALAYAPEPARDVKMASPAPIGRAAPMAAFALPIPAFIPPATAVVIKQPEGRPALVQTRREIQLNMPFDDPWLRAAIVTPDLTHYMSAMAIGETDYRSLDVFMRKPSSAVTMAFSTDPNSGLAADHFSGNAVVFLATTIFSSTRTALLQ